MDSDLKERVERLEQQVRELTTTVRGAVDRNSWQRTFGLSADDPGFDDMVRLGREIRARDRPKAQRKRRDAGA